MNYYKYLFIILTPILTFLGKDSWPKRTKIIYMLFVIGVCYLLIILSVSRVWELRLESAVTPEQLEMATGDGANKVFTLFLGWIPASVYVGFWMIIKRLVMKNKIKYKATV